MPSGLSRQDPAAGKDKASRRLHLPQCQATGTTGREHFQLRAGAPRRLGGGVGGTAPRANPSQESDTRYTCLVQLSKAASPGPHSPGHSPVRRSPEKRETPKSGIIRGWRQPYQPTWSHGLCRAQLPGPCARGTGASLKPPQPSLARASQSYFRVRVLRQGPPDLPTS